MRISGLTAFALTLALGATLVATPLRLSAQQPIAPAADTIQVSATGEFKADPDTAVVDFLVTGEETELRYAYAKAQAQADQVRELLRSQGFAPEAAQVGTYNVEPNLDPKTRRVIDYTVVASITLDLTDFSKLGPLLDAAGADGLNALRDVTFVLRNQDAAKASAIADGYRQVHQEALALATAAGLRLDGLAYASVDVDASSVVREIHPLAEGMALASAAPPTAEFTPRQIAVTARVDASYRIHY